VRPVVRLAQVPWVALCALAAHAALYRSFWPSGGVHGYFGWYEPLIGGLSAVSVVVLPLAVALAVRARGRRDVAWRGVIDDRLHALSGVAGPTTVRLAFASVVVLVVQESCELSVALRHPTLATFPVTGWLVIMAAAFAAAAIVTFLARSCLRVARRVLDARGCAAARRGVCADWQPVTPRPARRRNPLAARLALRGPPPATA
jgi:hypothetical protein